VVAVSAGVTEEKQADCIAAGAKAFLTKPIQFAALAEELGRLLNLTWIYEDSQQPAPAVDPAMEPCDLPEAAQMDSLRELAKAGNMRAIRERAEELAASNERYRPFADRITQLALGYQSKALLRLVEKHAAQQQMDPREQVTNS
jgi:CheY-like chemotaxis protein